MAAGKVKVPMGLQKSSPNYYQKNQPPPKTPFPAPKTPFPPPTSGTATQKGTLSHSFGVYFPPSSAHVQPRPPDVGALLQIIEELRQTELRLKNELVEQKHVKESVSIVPVLEREIAIRDAKVEGACVKIHSLEVENRRLRDEIEELRKMIKEERKVNQERIKSMEGELAEMKKMAAERKEEMNSKKEHLSSSQRIQALIEVSGKSNLIQNLKRVTKSSDIVVNQEKQMKFDATPETQKRDKEEAETGVSSLSSGPPRFPKPPPKPTSFSTEQKIPLLLPPPPATTSGPPPPPPPPKEKRTQLATVRRVPEVVELYHSLMRRDSRRDPDSAISGVPASSSNRDMIGEIENRSSYLLAIKTDVETQGEFIRSLIKEVERTSFTDIEDVVPFVKWLDDELSYLVDERAVLKHFDWPEQKADALREAAFGYCDLKKLQSEASLFQDSARQPCSVALNKMQALFEKLEYNVYNVSRMRESATQRYARFKIPMDWMLESRITLQIKLASVKLATKYMRRVLGELEIGASGSPEEEQLIVRGVRFAFRVHQFAGGFDVETIRTFQELRDKARSWQIQSHKHQQKPLSWCS